MTTAALNAPNRIKIAGERFRRRALWNDLFRSGFYRLVTRLHVGGPGREPRNREVLGSPHFWGDSTFFNLACTRAPLCNDPR